MHSHKFWNNPDTSKAKKALRILLIVVGFVLLAFLLGFWIMFLWNITIAAIFDLPTITYWQAIGLFLLAKMFFGIGGRSHRSKFKHRKWHTEKQTDDSEFTSSTAFKEFWQGEGKQAYDAYLAAREENQNDRTE